MWWLQHLGPVSACKTAVEAICNKSFQCYPMESQAAYGNFSGCVNSIQGVSCNGVQSTCPGGRKFNSDNASACVDGYKNESCADFLNGNVPTICNQICT